MFRFALAIAMLAIMLSVQAETPTELLKQFTPQERLGLARAFVGEIREVFTTPGMPDTQAEMLRLSVLSPPDAFRGLNAMKSPYLAPTLAGSGTGPGFALQADWPTAKEISELTQARSYAALVKVLGQPTQVGKGDGIYHRVWWKLFRPVDADTIEVLELTVDRVSKFSPGHFDVEKVEDVSVSGLQTRLGTLRREK